MPTWSVVRTSRKRFPIGIALTGEAFENGPSTISSESVGDTTHCARGIHQQQVESNAKRAPMLVFRENNFGGRHQARLLTNGQGGSRVGPSGASFDLNDRKKTFLLGNYVNLACRGSESARQDIPAIPLQGHNRGIFGGTALLIGELPSKGAIHLMKTASNIAIDR